MNLTISSSLTNQGLEKSGLFSQPLLASKVNGGNARMKQQESLTQRWLEQKLGGKPKAESAKKNTPASQNAKRAQQSRQQYERELRACRTKQEAEAVRMRWHQMISTEMRAIDQSGMDAEQKAQAKAAAASRLAAVESAHQEFRQSSSFQSLPEDDEEREEKHRQKVGGSDDKEKNQGIDTREISGTRGGASAGRISGEKEAANASSVKPASAPAPARHTNEARPASSGNERAVDVYA